VVVVNPQDAKISLQLGSGRRLNGDTITKFRNLLLQQTGLCSCDSVLATEGRQSFFLILKLLNLKFKDVPRRIANEGRIQNAVLSK
jgi:hypothetical protein